MRVAATDSVMMMQTQGTVDADGVHGVGHGIPPCTAMTTFSKPGAAAMAAAKAAAEAAEEEKQEEAEEA